MRRIRSVLVVAWVAAAGVGAWGDEATVTVDANTRYQTIEAWGATTPGGDCPDALREEMIDLAANTEVTGLSVAGDYLFRVAIADPTHTVAKDMRMHCIQYDRGG